MKKYVLFLLLLVSGKFVAQLPGISYLNENYAKFIPQRTYNTDLGQRYNSPEYYGHPDFGKLTFDAPVNKNVVEDLSKRTLDGRYYIDVNDPSFFYIQKSSKPINFYKNGYLRAIDPTLKEVVSGIYKAENQPCPTELNTVLKQSVITLGNESFSFNNFSLKVIKNDNSTQVFTSNWSNRLVGNNGAYITNVFPGIDMKIMYKEAGVEADFIIKQNLHVKQLVFVDNLQISSNLSMTLEPGMDTDHTKGHLIISDQNNQPIALINPPKTSDNSGTRTLWFNPCSLVANKFEILCDSTLLNSSQTVYPVTVDPLVTAVGPISVGTTNLMGSLVSPSFCSNTLAVTFPGGTTPWDASLNWSVTSNYCYAYYTGHGFFGDACWRSEAQINVTTSCGGRSPASPFVWTCSPSCNSTGNWIPTIAFGSSGTQSLAQCYTASCAAQTMNFSINFNRTICTAYTPYDVCSPTGSYCQTLNNWAVTVQGRNMETQGNTTTGNSTTAVSAICFAGQTLSPSVLYGITPYAYSWSPGGETTSSKTIPTNYVGTQTHSCTVTDACGLSRVATFNVTTNCVLPVELLSFDGEVSGRNVELHWKTATEANSSHFTVERSYDAVNFSKIATVKAAGNSTSNLSYSIVDGVADLKQIVYYRLKQFDNGMSTERYSTVIDVEAKVEAGLDVFPNPGTGLYEILPLGNYADKVYDIVVYDYMGKQVLKQSGITDKGTVNLTDYPAGIYLLKINIGGKQINRNVIKQ